MNTQAETYNCYFCKDTKKIMLGNTGIRCEYCPEKPANEQLRRQLQPRVELDKSALHLQDIARSVYNEACNATGEKEPRTTLSKHMIHSLSASITEKERAELPRVNDSDTPFRVYLAVSEILLSLQSFIIRSHKQTVQIYKYGLVNYRLVNKVSLSPEGINYKNTEVKNSIIPSDYFIARISSHANISSSISSIIWRSFINLIMYDKISITNWKKIRSDDKDKVAFCYENCNVSNEDEFQVSTESLEQKVFAPKEAIITTKCCDFDHATQHVEAYIAHTNSIADMIISQCQEFISEHQVVHLRKSAIIKVAQKEIRARRDVVEPGFVYEKIFHKLKQLNIEVK